MAILFAIETASPNGLFSQTTASFALPYFAISLSLNVVLTCLIVSRILMYQRSSRVVLGSDYGKHYTSIWTMFVESAALYTICGILLLTTFGPGNPINQIWLGLAPSVQVCGAQRYVFSYLSDPHLLPFDR